MDISLGIVHDDIGLDGVVVQELQDKITVVTFEIMRETYRDVDAVLPLRARAKFRHTIYSFDFCLSSPHTSHGSAHGCWAHT